MVSFPIRKKKKSAGEDRVTVQKESSFLSRVQRLFSRKRGTKGRHATGSGQRTRRTYIFYKKCGIRYWDNGTRGRGIISLPGSSPGSPLVQAEEQKRSFLERGNAHFRAGQYVKVLQMYDQALSLDSIYVKAWNNRSLALQKMGRNREAADSRQRFFRPAKARKVRPVPESPGSWSGTTSRWSVTRMITLASTPPPGECHVPGDLLIRFGNE